MIKNWREGSQGWNRPFPEDTDPDFKWAVEKRWQARIKAAQRLNENRPPFHSALERAVRPEEIDEGTVDAVLAEERAAEIAEARQRERAWERVQREVEREAYLAELRSERAQQARKKAQRRLYGPPLSLEERRAIIARARAKLRGR